MIPSIQSFARAVHRAHIERKGFSATQTITSGQLRIDAEIRQVGHRSTALQFNTYQNPWTDLEEALSGHVEYTGDELCSVAIHREGSKTWVVDPAMSTATRKLGSHLYEPIPGVSALGELSFLARLTQDFLLRDLGEHAHGDGKIRRVSLKPKQAYQVNLLSTVTFPVRSVTIDFDTQTYFPHSISLLPSTGSPASSIVGPQTSIVVSYSDVKIAENGTTDGAYEPQADMHIFEESMVAVQDLEDHLPFDVPLHVISEQGFSANAPAFRVTLDSKKERSYLTMHFSPVQPSSDDETERPRLSVTCGNFMSRNMARRRITLSEQGTQADDEVATLSLLDRGTLWEARFPGVDTQQAPVEVSFEKAGVFWFLHGTNIELESLKALALAIFNADGATSQAEPVESE